MKLLHNAGNDDDMLVINKVKDDFFFQSVMLAYLEKRNNIVLFTIQSIIWLEQLWKLSN